MPNDKDNMLLKELPEDQATGRIAAIYDEIRRYCAVPYVSSLQRHLATMPGVLEWAWTALRPAVVSGRIPEDAWRLAQGIDIAPLPPISRAALRVLGVDAAGEAAIRNICDNFIQVSPINLLFSGSLRLLLNGARPGATATSDAPDWTPPAMLPPMPALIDPAALDADRRAVLFQLGTEVGGQTFVPGPYRMVARWPGYLAHMATQLGPLFDDPATKTVCAALADRIDTAAPDIVAGLPPLPDGAPDSATGEVILAALDKYRKTSPEMVVFHTLLRDALPAAD